MFVYVCLCLDVCFSDLLCLPLPVYIRNIRQCLCICLLVACGGTVPFDRDLWQVLHLQLPVALRRVNSNTVSISVVGSASERLVPREALKKWIYTIQYNTSAACAYLCLRTSAYLRF